MCLQFSLSQSTWPSGEDGKSTGQQAHSSKCDFKPLLELHLLRAHGQTKLQDQAQIYAVGNTFHFRQERLQSQM